MKTYEKILNLLLYSFKRTRTRCLGSQKRGLNRFYKLYSISYRVYFQYKDQVKFNS